MSSLNTWRARAGIVITCAIGLIISIVFAGRLPWWSYYLVNLCITAILLVSGGTLLALLRADKSSWAQKHSNWMQVFPVAVGIVSMACFPLSLQIMAPWEVDDPTSAQRLSTATNRQLITLANKLSDKLKEQEQRNDAAYDQIINADMERSRRLKPAERLQGLERDRGAIPRLLLQQAIYFRRHYKPFYDVLANELRKRTRLPESDFDRFSLQADEDLAGAEPLNALADDLLKQANALPPDLPD